MMKRLILLLVLIFSVCFFGKAQKIPTAEEIAKKNVEEIHKRLKLTSTQKSIIYNYAFDMAKEQLAFYKKQQLGQAKPEDETRVYKLRNELNTNIKAVLKEGQVAEYDKLNEERLSGIDPKKKKKKKKKGEEEDKIVGIEGLKSVEKN